MSSIANITIVPIEKDFSSLEARERKRGSFGRLDADTMLPTTSKGSTKGSRGSGYRSYSFLPQYLRRIVKVSIAFRHQKDRLINCTSRPNLF
jgi:hypothetical protein